MKNIIILLAVSVCFGQVQNLEQIPYKGNVSSVQMNRILGSLNDAIGAKVTDVSVAPGDILIRGSNGWLRIVHPGASANYLCSTGGTTAGWCASPIPGVSVLLKGNGLGGASAANVADITSLFSGNGAYLRADGTRGDPAGSGGGTWGGITGLLTNQSDLTAALSGKQNALTTGTPDQYIRADLSLAPFPAIPTIGNGVLKGSGGNAVAATSADIAALWTGTGAYMRSDGTLGDPSGAGGGVTPAGPVGSLQTNGGSGALGVAVAGVDYAAANASTTVNGQTCALGSTCTVADATKVPTTRTVNGHALSADVTVTKADVGLSAVDNTSDASKPISTATQAALDAKVPVTRTINGKPLSADVTLAKADLGLGNADNTSDVNKPVSAATQTALNAKQNLITTGTTSQYLDGTLALRAFPTIPTVGTGILKGSSGNAVSAAVADVVALWTSCGSNFMKGDGTCATSPMTYPASGIANSTGGGWGTSYSVVSSVSNPGSSTAIPTEAAVMNAIQNPPSVTVAGSADGAVDLCPAGDAVNCSTLQSPASRTAPLTMVLPQGVPTSGQVITWGAPVAGKTTGTFSTPSTGIADPGANGLMKRTALNTTAAATAGTDYQAPITGGPCSAGQHVSNVDATTGAVTCTADAAGSGTPAGSANAVQCNKSSAFGACTASDLATAITGGTLTVTLSNGTLASPSLASSYIGMDHTWDATGGPTGSLVTYSSTGVSSVAPTLSTNVNGIVAPGSPTGGGTSIKVARIGKVACNFDGAATQGNIAIVSSTIAGDCHDAGTADQNAIPATVQVIGRVASTIASAGSATVYFFGPGHRGGQTGSVNVDAFGAVGNGSTDDTAAVQAALNVGGKVTTTAGKTYIVSSVTINSNTTLECADNSGFKKLAGSVSTYILAPATSAANVTIRGCSIDTNSVAQTTTQAAAMFIGSLTNFLFERNTLKNTGTPVAGMGGLYIYNSSAVIRNNSFQSSVIGTQVTVDPNNQTTKQVVIERNTFDGCKRNAIYLTNPGGTEKTGNIIVSSNNISNVTDDTGGTGQQGNAIVNYQVDGTQIINNVIRTTRFSGVRVNKSTNVEVSGNLIDGSQETSLYAELGAWGNRFVQNRVINFVAGMALTNVSSRVPDMPNIAFGNTFINGKSFGIAAEHDEVRNNYFDGVPIGIRVGNGSTSHDNVVIGNTCQRSSTSYPQMVACIGIDKSINTGADRISGTVRGTTLAGYDIVPVDMPGAITISAITQANPAVISYTGSQPVNGATWCFSNIGGMVELNGQCGTVSSSTASTFAVNIDSTAYTAFAALGGGQNSNAWKLYSSGTTFAFAIPAGTIAYGSGFYTKTVVLGGGNTPVTTTDAITEGQRFTRGVVLSKCAIGATTGPVGAALTVNLLKNGSNVGTCSVADGQTQGTAVLSIPFATTDTLTFSVASVGTTTAARGVSMELEFAY